MTNEQQPANLEDTSKRLWNEIKSATDSVFDRELTSHEFYYLLSRYPYLDICDIDYPYIDKPGDPKIITTKNGWKIFDYGSVLSSGAYELMARQGYMKGQPSPDAVDEGEGGSGTIIQQYSDVAFEMIALAMARGWRQAEIISGFYGMQRMAWIAAVEKGYLVKGFDGTPEDYVILDWVTKLRSGKMYPPEKPIIKQEPKLR